MTGLRFGLALLEGGRIARATQTQQHNSSSNNNVVLPGAMALCLLRCVCLYVVSLFLVAEAQLRYSRRVIALSALCGD